MSAVKKKVNNLDRLASLRDKLKKVDTGGGRGGFWSPKAGKNTIRILPEVHDMQYFFQTVGKHEFPPDRKRYVYCPSFTSEGELDCPVCELVGDLYKAGDKASKTLASTLYTRRSYWMNIIDRADEDKGPLIFTPGVTIFNALVSIINDPDYGDITDIEEGFDVTIERSGTGIDTEYQVRCRPRSSPLSTDKAQIDEWLEKAANLLYVEVSEDPAEDKELAKGHAIYVLPYDRIVDEFDLENIDNVVGDTDDEEEEEEEVSKRKPSRVKSKPPVVEEEEEEEEDVDEEDDEEETVASKEIERRRAARPSRRR
jgi:hypothetical protein